MYLYHYLGGPSQRDCSVARDGDSLLGAIGVSISTSSLSTGSLRHVLPIRNSKGTSLTCPKLKPDPHGPSSTGTP